MALASFVCMSMQYAQPLSCEARTRTSSRNRGSSHLDLVGRRVRAELENALRDDVRTGRLRPGMRLPSSRALALDLGIARNTVANAYDQLVAEGWLTARRGLRHTRCAASAGLVVGYGTPPEHAFTAAVARLSAVLAGSDASA